jgi:hypothetical protein
MGSTASVRPRQGVGNPPLGKCEGPAPARRLASKDVVCEERLGGLLRHYRGAA